MPLYVCSSLFKLTPNYKDDENKFASPNDSLGQRLDGTILSEVLSSTPVFEYVPPELVTLFISNVPGHAPSYVYRLLTELYHPEDYVL